MKKLFVVFLSSFITSCSMGTYEIKVDYSNKQNFYIEKTDSKSLIKEVNSDISVTAEWIGNAYPMVTSKGVTGLNNRFVIPYTRLTSLVHLKISNNSDKYIDFNNNDVYLSFLDNKVKPLDLEFFKGRWPSFSVKTQEMLVDRSVAIGEVIRTILRDEKISPKSIHQGYIPFLKIPDDIKELNLSTIIKIDGDSKNIDFRFIRK
jgi:hypothetical protein